MKFEESSDKRFVGEFSILSNLWASRAESAVLIAVPLQKEKG